MNRLMGVLVFIKIGEKNLSSNDVDDIAFDFGILLSKDSSKFCLVVKVTIVVHHVLRANHTFTTTCVHRRKESWDFVGA